MSVKVTLEFESLTDAGNFLLTASGSISGDGPMIVAPPTQTITPTEKPKKARTPKQTAEPAAAPAAATPAPVAAQAAAPAPGGGPLDDAYLKALTEAVLAVAAEVNRETALGLLAQYKMTDGATPVARCSDLPKEGWVAVRTQADTLLSAARAKAEAVTAAAASTSLI